MAEERRQTAGRGLSGAAGAVRRAAKKPDRVRLLFSFSEELCLLFQNGGSRRAGGAVAVQAACVLQGVAVSGHGGGPFFPEEGPRRIR